MDKNEMRKDAEIIFVAIANFLWAGLGYVAMRLWWGFVIMAVYFVISYSLFFYSINYPVILILSFLTNLGFAIHAGFLAFLRYHH